MFFDIFWFGSFSDLFQMFSDLVHLFWMFLDVFSDVFSDVFGSFSDVFWMFGTSITSKIQIDVATYL